MSAPNAVSANVVQEQNAPANNTKGHVLGTLASVGIGAATGNWVPAISSVLGSAAGAAQAVQSSTSTPSTTTTPSSSSSSSSDSSKSESTTDVGSAATNANTPLSDTPSTTHAHQANQIADSIATAPQNPLAQYIDPRTGSLNPQALLSLMSSGGNKSGPNAQQVQQQSLAAAPTASQMSSPTLASGAASGNAAATPAFGAGTLGQVPTNQFTT